MSSIDYNDLKRHIGHKIVCVGYGALKLPISKQNKNRVYDNVAMECLDCCEIILDYERGELK